MSTKPETSHAAGQVSECSLASGDLLGAYEHAIIAIRDRAARLANEADTEAVLKPAREIIIECERVLERHNQAHPRYTRRCDVCSPCFDCWENPRRCRKPDNNAPEAPAQMPPGRDNKPFPQPGRTFA